MKLVLLFGDSAVGKMTVGQELTKITKLRLFHNHMMIEPVLEVFSEFKSDTIKRLRDVVFEDFAKSEHEGLIFTFMWAFNYQEDWDYVAHIVKIFEKRGAEIYYIELDADMEARIERNTSENRLNSKKSKRNIEKSNAMLLNAAERYRCVSLEGELDFKNFLRIDNTNVSARDAAFKIKEYFSL